MTAADRLGVTLGHALAGSVELAGRVWLARDVDGKRLPGDFPDRRAAARAVTAAARAALEPEAT